jgi:hypothetical protein
MGPRERQPIIDQPYAGGPYGLPDNTILPIYLDGTRQPLLR